MQTWRFRDFDAFADTVCDVDAEMLLQNPGRRQWSISLVALDGIHVQGGQEGGGNISEGQSRPDGYALYLPLKHPETYAANGTALDENSIVILEPGCEFCVSSTMEGEWCSISIPSDRMPLGVTPEETPASLSPACRTHRITPDLSRKFQGIVSRILVAAGGCPQIESGPSSAVAAAEVLSVIASVLGNGQHVSRGRGQPPIPRQEIIERSKAFLEARHDQPICVGELAAAADVSERTLRTAFNEYFGVGPSRYLQLRQLNQIQRALRACDPDEASVSRVLVDHGVWEHSRFARRYRQLFGELPSETLQNKGR